MRFRTIQWTAAFVALAIIAALMLMMVGERPRATFAMLLLGAPGVGVGYAIVFAAQRRRRRAYVLALTSDDAVAVRRAFERFADIFRTDNRPSTRAQLAGHEAALLIREHRFREAAARLERVDVPATAAPALLPLRAFTLAHLGEEVGALALVEEALPAASIEVRTALERTRAIVLQRLGRNGEAVTLLAQAIDDGPRAVRLFYLAEAQRGLGRIDEAVATFERVTALPGESGWHAAARDALKTLRTKHAFR